MIKFMYKCVTYIGWTGMLLLVQAQSSEHRRMFEDQECTGEEGAQKVERVLELCHKLELSGCYYAMGLWNLALKRFSWRTVVLPKRPLVPLQQKSVWGVVNYITLHFDRIGVMCTLIKDLDEPALWPKSILADIKEISSELKLDLTTKCSLCPYIPEDEIRLNLQGDAEALYKAGTICFGGYEEDRFARVYAVLEEYAKNLGPYFKCFALEYRRVLEKMLCAVKPCLPVMFKAVSLRGMRADSLSAVDFLARGLSPCDEVKNRILLGYLAYHSLSLSFGCAPDVDADYEKIFLELNSCEQKESAFATAQLLARSLVKCPTLADIGLKVGAIWMIFVQSSCGELSRMEEKKDFYKEVCKTSAFLHNGYLSKIFCSLFGQDIFLLCSKSLPLHETLNAWSHGVLAQISKEAFEDLVFSMSYRICDVLKNAKVLYDSMYETRQYRNARRVARLYLQTALNHVTFSPEESLRKREVGDSVQLFNVLPFSVSEKVRLTFKNKILEATNVISCDCDSLGENI